MGIKKTLFLLLIATLLTAPVGQVRADEPAVKIVVKTVLASQDATPVDPRISALTQKLQSVFRYSSYRLISEDNMQLRIGETGTVSLPGDRMLKITPLRVTGNRAELQLLIFKNERQIIKTRIQVLNHGSITVGGPEHKGGFLLFDIFNSF
ncbi:MAG: hypothetical protein ISS68_01590 [Desulfobacteraceae bacterium]|nr:hypothetical protein [Desulfobacteraceae bacterium]MBU0733288.1 hypothetical protein [Pseudomonadota bacterium]